MQNYSWYSAVLLVTCMDLLKCREKCICRGYLCFTHPANTNARLNKVFINYVYSYGEPIKLSFLDSVCQKCLVQTYWGICGFSVSLWKMSCFTITEDNETRRKSRIKVSSSCLTFHTLLSSGVRIMMVLADTKHVFWLHRHTFSDELD